MVSAPGAAVKPLIELPDGSVVIPPGAVPSLRGWLVRQLVVGVRRDGGEPSAYARDLVYALNRAQHHHDQGQGDAAGFAPESAPAAAPTVEITTAEAAHRLGCSAQHVRQLCRSGAFQARQVGGAWLIDRATFDAWRYATEAA